MSAGQVPEFNQDPDFEDAVDALIERHGLDAAEGRLLAALSLVRRRKVEAARGGD